MLDLLLKALVASGGESLAAGLSKELRLTNNLALTVADAMPSGAEISRRGQRFMGGCQLIASGIAPVSAIPTTTATLALYNTEADGGKSLVLEKLNVFLGSGTAAAGAAIMVTVSNGKPASVPSAASNYSSQSMSGIPKTSVARWATAVTIPSGSAWLGIASNFQLAAANVGQGDSIASLDGQLVVPPGYCLGIAIVSGAGTSPLYQISATWSELALALV